VNDYDFGTLAYREGAHARIRAAILDSARRGELCGQAEAAFVANVRGAQTKAAEKWLHQYEKAREACAAFIRTRTAHSAPACPKCGASTGPTHDIGPYGAIPIWKCTVCDGWLHRSLEPNGPMRRGTPSPKVDGSACPDCGWLVRRIQDDGSARMEHAYNCRRNQPNVTEQARGSRAEENA
jgi:hypothetical protein